MLCKKSVQKGFLWGFIFSPLSHLSQEAKNMQRTPVLAKQHNIQFLNLLSPRTRYPDAHMDTWFPKLCALCRLLPVQKVLSLIQIGAKHKELTAHRYVWFFSELTSYFLLPGCSTVGYHIFFLQFSFEFWMMHAYKILCLFTYVVISRCYN